MEPYKQIKMLHSVYSLFLLFLFSFFELQAFAISDFLIMTCSVFLNATFTNTDHNIGHISTQTVNQNMKFMMFSLIFYEIFLLFRVCVFGVVGVFLMVFLVGWFVGLVFCLVFWVWFFFWVFIFMVTC